MSCARAHCGMTGKTTPLYVVCSPCRSVGKTLISRLLTEFYVIKDCPVAAVDLADEGPQLADYLPKFATIADIGDIRGQMALFDRLIAKRDIPTVIDVSHRAFKNFFTIVRDISFFDEARRRSIAPLILFIIDPNATKAYGMLSRQFNQTSLLPVRNRIEASAIVRYVGSPNASMPPSSLDIPLLGFSLRALIDQPSFTFSQFWWTVSTGLPQGVDAQLLRWLECIFSQLHHLERFLRYEGRSAPVTVQGSRCLRPTDPAVNRFSGAGPKKERCIDHPVDQLGKAIVAMLQKAAELSNNEWARTKIVAIDLSHQLRSVEDRINQLQAEIKDFRHRAVQAETWLERFQREVEQKLIAPRQAPNQRSKA
jgi:hypothetical protein